MMPPPIAVRRRGEEEINYANGMWRWQTSLRIKGHYQSHGPYSQYVMLAPDSREHPGARLEGVNQLMVDG